MRLTSWKNFLTRYFDFNGNRKVETWEVVVFVAGLVIFQLVIQVAGNWLYDLIK